MATTYTIDASVFLNAFNPYEVGHADSQSLLDRLQQAAAPIIVPTLLLPEIAAAISRGRKDEALATEFSLAVSRLPHLMLIPLDDTLARQAADVAAKHRLRGSDAVYAAVALRFGCTLVTLDQQQRLRVSQALPACTPLEAIAGLGLVRGD